MQKKWEKRKSTVLFHEEYWLLGGKKMKTLLTDEKSLYNVLWPLYIVWEMKIPNKKKTYFKLCIHNALDNYNAYLKKYHL